MSPQRKQLVKGLCTAESRITNQEVIKREFLVRARKQPRPAIDLSYTYCANVRAARPRNRTVGSSESLNCSFRRYFEKTKIDTQPYFDKIALWTYAELVKLADTKPEAEEARREFDDDVWVQRARAAQVLRPLFLKYGRLRPQPR